MSVSAVHGGRRLATGSHVLTYPELVGHDPKLAGLLLVSPQGEMATVVLPSPDEPLLKAILYGDQDIDSVSALAKDPALLVDIVNSCLQSGLLVPFTGPTLLEILLIGEGVLADMVADIACREPTLVVRRIPALPADQAPSAAKSPKGVVVACSDVLPDADWIQLDETCQSANIRWHRAYGEGEQVAVGPLSLPGRSASYGDLRSRRLAASPNPDELTALWHHLSSADIEVTLSPTICAIAAGHLVADLVHLACGGNPAGTRSQVVIDPLGPTVSRHPVLPLPQEKAA